MPKEGQPAAHGTTRNEERRTDSEISTTQRIFEDETRECKLKDSKVQAYPSYLRIHNEQELLVKGSTCQLVMTLVEEGASSAEISRKIGRKTRTEYYSAREIAQLVQTCEALQLNGSSPLATADWENEPIEGWWFMEEAYCKALRRQKPVSEEICGYACNEGWWKDRQKQEHRDWVRFGDRSIGPEKKRRT
ncbi:hypothetical protein PV08_08775 [Exophiala spinifera]|uniref:Uncharacterized protein n=1 Tax=Exophiala spinifera TaxID=91928 RepID=A0A0D1YEV3_9EURO|nr:uncharacterized protein PV08_08775 [Exophiala spinifera]KIW13586.1 hypothetical protein PV08_08775 [Exophiala spinifera]